MLERLLKKAGKSQCTFKVGALAVSKKGDIIGLAFSEPRFSRYGGSIHAEMKLMKHYGKMISRIYICRVNKSKQSLPIHACSVCQKTADSLGIKILPILEAKIL